MRHGKNWRTPLKTGNKRMRKAVSRGLFKAAAHYSDASSKRRMKRWYK